MLNIVTGSIESGISSTRRLRLAAVQYFFILHDKCMLPAIVETTSYILLYLLSFGILVLNMN
jgi:hypothetical protein